jgi:hypothetical protein
MTTRGAKKKPTEVAMGIAPRGDDGVKSLSERANSFTPFREPTADLDTLATAGRASSHVAPARHAARVVTIVDHNRHIGVR